MDFLEKLFDKDPFLKNEKSNLFNKNILSLTKHHYKNSSTYKSLIDKFNFNFNNHKKLENLPYLPITLFKELDLVSVSNDNIIKTLFSSGTSGAGRSKIFFFILLSLTK